MSVQAATTSVRRWFAADPRRFDVALAAATVAVSFASILVNPERFDVGWPEVAAGVGAFVLVALRRRWPLGVLAVAVVAAALHVVVLERPSPMIFASLVLLASAAVRLERRQAILLGLVVGVTLYGAALFTTDFSLGDARALIALAWTGVAVGVGDATRSWREYKASSEAQLRSTVLAAEAQTRRQVTEERLQIARELHDLLAHNLSVMNVQTGAAMHLLHTDPDAAEEALRVSRDAGRTVLDELRELLAVLRHDDDTDGDSIAPTAALPAVDQLGSLVDTMRATGLAVSWTDSGTPRELAPAVSLAAYRIVQEALTNAAKHGSGSVELTTVWDADHLAITVINTPGADATEALAPSPSAAQPSGGRHGLIGMRERATSNGGSFEAGLVDGRFVVSAELPVARDRAVSGR